MIGPNHPEWGERCEVVQGLVVRMSAALQGGDGDANDVVSAIFTMTSRTVSHLIEESLNLTPVIVALRTMLVACETAARPPIGRTVGDC